MIVRKAVILVVVIVVLAPCLFIGFRNVLHLRLGDRDTTPSLSLLIQPDYYNDVPSPHTKLLLSDNKSANDTPTKPESDKSSVCESRAWKPFTSDIEKLFIKYKTESNCPVLLKTYHSYSKYRNSIIHGLKADDHVSSDRNFIESLIQNCTKTYNDFSKRFYVSDFEKNFPIAFEMLIYYRPLGIQQYIRLLRNIYRPQNAYCIHIDTRSPKWWIDSINSFASCFPNVLMAKHSIKVEYATSDILNAHLHCFDTLLDSNLEWNYVISLHGTELPLTTNRQMVIKLKEMNGSNIISEGVNASNPKFEFYEWISLVHSHSDPRSYGEKVNLTTGYTMYKSAASANSAISRPMAQYMLTNKKALELTELLKTAQTAIEFFFPTINNFKDAPGGVHTLSSDFRMPLIAQRDWIRYYGKGKTNIHKGFCEGRKVQHLICIVSAYDLPRLYEISKMGKWWFHNKYFIEYDYTVIDCLEKILSERNKDEYCNS